MNNGQHIRMKNLYSIYVYTVYNSMYVVAHIYIFSYILPYLRLYVYVYTYKHVYTQIRKNIRKHVYEEFTVHTYCINSSYVHATFFVHTSVCIFFLIRVYTYILPIHI